MRAPSRFSEAASRRPERSAAPARLGAGLALLTLAAGSGASAQSRLDFAGPPGSSKPYLTATPSGALLLTWFEPAGEGRFALRIASREGGRWSEPRTVAADERFFVNWADFPSAAEATSGAWAVHWLEKTEAKPYAYHVRVSRSLDRGRTWSPPLTAHSDRSPVEHGFVAMIPDQDEGVRLAWLDGRQMASDSGGSMSLRSARLRGDGTVADERLLDGRTCDCCQVAMARADAGLVAVYRDRSDDEVRDIAIVREVGGRWSDPALVSRDGWVTRACPVNGPSIDAAGPKVAVAWFTMADAKPRVYLAYSPDGGAGFGPPIRIDEGNPLGRVQVRLGPGGSAFVVWLEAVGDRGEWRIRPVDPAGRPGRSRLLGRTERSRNAGFARAAALGSDLFVAWAEPGTDGRVVVYRTGLR